MRTSRRDAINRSMRGQCYRKWARQTVRQKQRGVDLLTDKQARQKTEMYLSRRLVESARRESRRLHKL
ncbi:hypothetical protein RRG08_056494 [Elysia crispata]|uniref:Uncharacterized protein n=1 Tax=Elysia crispata TaxID=231223 RepID=A0AAE1CJD1_9GAST|nr:hypothetical protein RRG08_056494 [Elysia crispata]